MRTREALLGAARHLFETKGYANTKIADITGGAGRALGSFYTYFENKEAVLECLAKDFKSDVESRVIALDLTTSDPYETIHGLCGAYWNSCRDHSAELAAIFQASMLDEHFAQRWREIRSDARRKIAEAIRAVGDAGLATDPDPEVTASALGSMMDYFCYVWLVEGGEADRSSIPDDIAIATMARVMYRTVFATCEGSTAELASPSSEGPE